MRRNRIAVSGGLAALLAIAATAAATIPKPGHFAGATSQVYPDGSRGWVSIEMTHRGRRIRSLDITWLAGCDSGFTALSQETHGFGSVSRRGRFHADDTYVSTSGNLMGTPYTATVTDRLRGRFVSRTRVLGTFQATATLADPSGRPVATCATPPIRWAARMR